MTTDTISPAGEINIAAAVAAEIKAHADAAFGPLPSEADLLGMRNRREQYWRFCPDTSCMKPGHVKQRNWIVVGPSMKSVHGEINFEQFRREKHAVPLPEYGHYMVGYELSANANASPQLPFGRFTEIVTKPGGIGEFPREQIIAYGWHRNPVIKKARPDLNDHEDIPCPYGCAGRLFPSEAAKMQHVEAAHEKQMVSESLSRGIAVPMEKMTEAVRQATADKGIDTDTIAAIVAATVAAITGAAPEQQASKEETPPVEATEPPEEPLRRAVNPR